MSLLLICGLITSSLISQARVAGQGIIFGDPTPEETQISDPFEKDEVPSDVEGSDVVLLRSGGEFDCRAPDGQDGRCTLFLRCLSLRQGLVPLTSSNIAYLRRSICKNTNKKGQLLVCCPPKIPQHLRPTTLPPLIFSSHRRTTAAPVTRPPTKKITPAVPATVPETVTPEQETSGPSSTAETSTEATPVTEKPVGFVDSSGKSEGSETTQAPPPTADNEVTDPPQKPTVVETDPTVSPSETSTSEASTSPSTSASTEPSSASTVSSLPGTEVSDSGSEPVEGSAEGLNEEDEATEAPAALFELPGLDTCGYRNATTIRIIGGRIAEPNSWPWLATLGYNLDGEEIDYLCGGALITERHVLTAAHCIRSELRTVRLGDHDLFNDTEVDTVSEHPVEAVFPHENYNNKTFVNDIGIIKLKTPVTFSDAVHPLCIPTSEEMQNVQLEGKTVFIAGWGTTKFRGEASEILKEAMVKVRRHQLCRVRYRALRHKLVDTQICASSQGNDACQGDSGGPMMFPDLEERWHVMGVVSFGFKCGEPRFPGVYTKVTPYTDWIANNLR